jgi:hypothetical protein
MASGIVNVALVIRATATGGSGTYNQYNWFENGAPYATTTGQNLNYVKNSAGTASITVTVTDSNSQTSPLSNVCTVTVSQASTPAVSLPASASGKVNETVSIGATASGGSGTYIKYEWFLEGSPYADTGATPSLSFTSSQPATLHFTVRVTDSQPLTSPLSNSCTVTISAVSNPTLSLLVSPSGAGTTSQNPAPPYSVNQQVQISVTITDPATYRFVHWTKEDGSELSTAQTTTITMDANHTYTAVLALIGGGPTLTVNATAGGSAVATEQPPYTPNQVVSVAATPTAGYALAAWLRDGIPYVDSSGDPLANPVHITLDQNHTLTAVFAVSGGGEIPWLTIAIGGVGGVLLLGYILTR